ncbi:MAG: hypothetical protein FWB74_07385 [Defluviitaleaceae bacterium]|nr:hypothetical protein [Defluviitaleaceae bacterium]
MKDFPIRKKISLLVFIVILAVVFVSVFLTFRYRAVSEVIGFASSNMQIFYSPVGTYQDLPPAFFTPMRAFTVFAAPFHIHENPGSDILLSKDSGEEILDLLLNMRARPTFSRYRQDYSEVILVNFALWKNFPYYFGHIWVRFSDSGFLNIQTNLAEPSRLYQVHPSYLNAMNQIIEILEFYMPKNSLDAQTP